MVRPARARRATPRDIVRALADAVTKARELARHGASGSSTRAPEPVGNTPEEFARRCCKDEVARWAEVVRISGARAD